MTLVCGDDILDIAGAQGKTLTLKICCKEKVPPPAGL
jgi:hypothetical protein